MNNLTYEEQGRKESIGSPIGTKVVKAKTVKGGVKVKANGTPMEMLTVMAALAEEIMLSTGTPLHEVMGAVEELIKGGHTKE